MFGLQRQSESVDDTAQDFEKFANAVKVFRLVDEPATEKEVGLKFCNWLIARHSVSLFNFVAEFCWS